MAIIRLSSSELHNIAYNEIRFRGQAAGWRRILDAYSATYPELTEQDAKHIADLIHGATITLPVIKRAGDL